MGEEKNLYNMNEYELAMMLLKEPERLDEVAEMLIESGEINRFDKIAGFMERDQQSRK